MTRDMNIVIDKNSEVVEEDQAKKQESDFVNFHILHIEDHGEEKQINIEPLLSISNKGLEFLSIEELDKSLEEVSAYRFSILTLKENITERLNAYKESIDEWQSANWTKAVKIAMNRRIQIKEDKKVSNGWFGSVTKEEIKGIYLSDKEAFPNYLQQTFKIRKYQKSSNILSDLLKILEDRGSQLQTIIKSKQIKKF